MHQHQHPTLPHHQLLQTEKKIPKQKQDSRATPTPLLPLYAANGLGVGLGVEVAKERFGSENPSEYDFARLYGSDAAMLDDMEDEKGSWRWGVVCP